MKNFDLKNKKVLITGASSGIGKELSACFAGEGSELYLGCLPAEAAVLTEWAGELKERHGRHVHTYPVDLSGADGPALLYREVVRDAGKIDVLVNNAGIIAYGNFHELSLERQEALVMVNLMAYMKLMRLFLPAMVAAGEGRVFNVCSAAAFQPSVHHAVYGAAKAFVQSLSEAVHRELRGTGVRVFTLNPSYTDTPLLKGNGFPERLWWYYFSGKSSPEKIARKGVRAFKKGKAVYIPGLRNWFVHAVLARLLPRGLAGAVSDLALREKKTGGRA